MSYKIVRALEHPRVDFVGHPSLARQEYSKDADINLLVRRFLRDGVIPQPNLGRESVDGLSIPGDFAQACEMAFEQLNQEAASAEAKPAEAASAEAKPAEAASAEAKPAEEQ